MRRPTAHLLMGCASLPAGSDRNSYSLYCAELMANMKDVPSTERMVLCSQQWKLLSQKEKDAYHKKCDQVLHGRDHPWRLWGPPLGVSSVKPDPSKAQISHWL